MTERIILCCGAGGWTRVIGWIQIVFYCMVTLAIGFGLVALFASGKDGFDKAQEENPSMRLAFGYAALIVFLVVSLLMVLVGIFMGVVLLKGSHERNTKYLRWWIVYAGVCLVWALMSVACNGRSILGVLLEGAITAAMYSFGIWIVRTHIHEIDSDPRIEPPPVYCATYAEKA